MATIEPMGPRKRPADIEAPAIHAETLQLAVRVEDARPLEHPRRNVVPAGRFALDDLNTRRVAVTGEAGLSDRSRDPTYLRTCFAIVCSCMFDVPS
jgi:hypothetical protein